MKIISSFKDPYDRYQDFNDTVIFNRSPEEHDKTIVWSLNGFVSLLNEVKSLAKALEYERDLGLLVMPSWVNLVINPTYISYDKNYRREFTYPGWESLLYNPRIFENSLYRKKKKDIVIGHQYFDGISPNFNHVQNLVKKCSDLQNNLDPLFKDLFEVIKFPTPYFLVKANGIILTGISLKSLYNDPNLPVWEMLYKEFDNSLKNTFHPENLVKIPVGDNDIRMKAAGFGKGSFITNKKK